VGDVSSGQLRTLREETKRWFVASESSTAQVYPRAYIDRTKRVDLSDLTVGEERRLWRGEEGFVAANQTGK